MSVTTLGSRSGDAAGAALGVVNYLDGRGKARGGQVPGRARELGRVDHGTRDVVGYYADSVEGPGIWIGRGTAAIRPYGQVDPEQLRRVLLGQDPFTGAQLVPSQGSAVRADQAGRQSVAVAAHGSDDELLSLPEAASLLHLSPRYLRRVAAQTAQVERMRARQHAAGEPLTPLPDTHLRATHDGGRAHWRVSRGEVRRFAAARRPPAAVVGYDLTFSVPKSVSILWASADPARQAQILDAVNDAVAAGLAYLEDNAACVRSRSGPWWLSPP